MKTIFILVCSLLAFASTFYAFAPQDSVTHSDATIVHPIDPPLVIERPDPVPQPVELSPVYVYGDRPVKVAAKRCVNYPLYGGDENVVICSR